VKLSLIPREHRFYELFSHQGALVSETLTELRNSLSEGKNRHPRLRELEHACDEVTHDIYNLTNRTFTTPMEQEDILRLAHGLDQIVDLAEEVSDKIDLYKIVSITDSAKQFGESRIRGRRRCNLRRSRTPRLLSMPFAPGCQDVDRKGRALQAQMPNQEHLKIPAQSLSKQVSSTGTLVNPGDGRGVIHGIRSAFGKTRHRFA